MKDFAKLFSSLDQTNSTLKKVAALVDYFDVASEQDKLWAVAILSSRRPKRSVTTKQLRTWAAELGGIPDWLFEESYSVVGDLAESIALILPEPTAESDNSLTEWIAVIKDLKGREETEQRRCVEAAWATQTRTERFLFNKLITGGFRIGVSQKLMNRALSQHSGIDGDVLAYRLMGDWTPDTTTYQELLYSDDDSAINSRPYPFYLANPLDSEAEALGEPDHWLVERKWDGIRGQIIVRQDEVFVWSRGEELITDRFPEYQPLATMLPHGTVIDGEILPWSNDKPLPFALLQTRIGRKKLTKSVLEKAPVIFMAYDLLEIEGADIRSRPMSDRREALEKLIANLSPNAILHLSPALGGLAWDQLREERARSRELRTEGLMIKRKDSTYKIGRKKGDWWKWKIDPLTIDAVMIYAMRGHGRRANLYTDYTFGVWQDDELITFTKAYSGLTDAEIRKVDHWVKRNTVERFGPVRSVKPELVMEIAFEGIQKSARHKSGIALRFPRIQRWRTDKPAEEANTLDDLKALLATHG